MKTEEQIKEAHRLLTKFLVLCKGGLFDERDPLERRVINGAERQLAVLCWALGHSESEDFSSFDTVVNALRRVVGNIEQQMVEGYGKAREKRDSVDGTDVEPDSWLH